MLIFEQEKILTGKDAGKAKTVFPTLGGRKVIGRADWKVTIEPKVDPKVNVNVAIAGMEELSFSNEITIVLSDDYIIINEKDKVWGTVTQKHFDREGTSQIQVFSEVPDVIKKVYTKSGNVWYPIGWPELEK